MPPQQEDDLDEEVEGRQQWASQQQPQPAQQLYVAPNDIMMPAQLQQQQQQQQQQGGSLFSQDMVAHTFVQVGAWGLVIGARCCRGGALMQTAMQCSVPAHLFTCSQSALLSSHACIMGAGVSTKLACDWQDWTGSTRQQEWFFPCRAAARMQRRRPCASTGSHAEPPFSCCCAQCENVDCLKWRRVGVGEVDPARPWVCAMNLDPRCAYGSAFEVCSCVHGAGQHALWTPPSCLLSSSPASMGSCTLLPASKQGCYSASRICSMRQSVTYDRCMLLESAACEQQCCLCIAKAWGICRNDSAGIVSLLSYSTRHLVLHVERPQRGIIRVQLSHWTSAC